MRTLFLLLPLTGALLAQTPPPDGLVSPQVSPDRTVTFRIRAPKASQVTLYGDWMPVGTQIPLTKDSEGVWSITSAPVPETIHLYWFNVDGVTIADPVNPRIKLRQRTSASLVEVPSQPPAIWDARDVPHGSVDVNWQHSKVLNGTTQEIYVYLPPGYEKGAARYPVLYLLHGSGDTAGSWTQVGAANLILDNLIADKKAKPMIIVMPLGHAVPFGSPRELQAKNTSIFEEYLMKEVMPWAEAKYRVAPGRQNHAIAGLSMGGGETIAVGFAHLDRFAYMGVFSSSAGPDFESKLPADVKLNVLWMGIGDKDPGFQRAKDFSGLLDKHNVHHTFQVMEGGAHTWPVWRVCLSEFAPLLFRGLP